MRLCSVTQVMSDSATPWTVARHTPRPMGFSPGKNMGELPFLPPRGSSQPGYWTHVSCVSCIGSHILYHWATWEAHGFVLNSFYYLEICSFYAHFGKSFFIMNVELWQILFLHLVDDHVASVFCLCVVSHWFAYVEPSLWT